MINIGVGLTWAFRKISRYVSNLILSFEARVAADGGNFEAEPCLAAQLNSLQGKGLLNDASLVITPNAIKESVLYDVVPNTSLGDLTVVRATSATRVNSSGLVEIPRTNLILQSQTFDNASWGKTNLTVTANNITAPDGTTTADKIIANTTNGTHSVNQFIAVGISTSHTVSLYAKKGEYSALRINFISSGNTFISVNLDTGVIVSFGGTIYLSSSIENVGDGWYRVTMTFLPPVATNSLNFFIENPVGTLTFAGDNTSGIYIWGAQLQLGNVATEYIPTVASIRTKFSGITQDGSSASNIPRLDYTNSTCPSILVEPQRTNLVTYSEQFDQWSKLGTFTVTANDSISPSGITNADRVEFTASVNLLYCSGTGSAGSNTVSVYAKAKSGTSKKFRFFGNGATTFSSDQVATNEWQRFTFTYTYSAQTSGLAGATTGASDVLFYGFQHEIGLYATSYIPTTSATVTRNADVISKTGISSLIGQTEGTIFLDYVWNNNLTDVIPVAINGNGGKFIWFRENGVQFYGNSSTLLFNYNSVSVYGNRYKLAFVYGQNYFRLYINGFLIGSSTSGTFTGTFDDFVFSPIGSSPYNDSMKFYSAILWKERLTDAELATLTTI